MFGLFNSVNILSPSMKTATQVYTTRCRNYLHLFFNLKIFKQQTLI